MSGAADRSLVSPEALAEAIAARASADGLACAAQGAQLVLAGGTVGVKLHAPALVREQANGVLLRAPFAFATTLRPDRAISEWVIGQGRDVAAATADAASQIATELLPLLVEATTCVPARCAFEDTGAPSAALFGPFPPGWRIVLGPLWRWSAKGKVPCCLHCLANVGAGALAPLLDSAGAACVRIFVGRQADGTAQADCRVNGVGMPDMAAEIVGRARLWPASDGFTMRRQTIMLVPKDAPGGAAS